MRSQVFFSMLVMVMTLCVAPSIAAPASARDFTLAQRGLLSLSKRVKTSSETTVCGVKIRGEANCDGKKIPLASKSHLGRGLSVRASQDSGSDWKPGSQPSTPSEETDDSDAGDSIQCDHAVELQLLDTYTNNNGFCTALEKLLHVIHGKAPTDAEMTPEIAPMKAKINVDKNFYPIPSKWNLRKKDFTVSFKGNKPATAPNTAELLSISKKIALYVKATTPYPVETNMETVGKDLDEEMEATFKKVKAEAEKKNKAEADKVTWTPAKTMQTYVKEYIAYIHNAGDLALKH